MVESEPVARGIRWPKSNWEIPADRPEGPPDEAWWERELLRNQKLMDRYEAAIGDPPDFSKWPNPQDLYNKVHYGIDAPERSDQITEDEDGEPDFDDVYEPTDGIEPDLEDVDEDPADDAGYEQVHELALKVAVCALPLKGLGPEADQLPITVGKVGAHLAGGHGMGYNDDILCANIVKCRGALADCEFSITTLEHLVSHRDRTDLSDLLEQCRVLAAGIKQRIEHLRARVWW